jgi:predicted small integral membrane protein
MAKTFAQNLVALRLVKIVLIFQIGAFALLVGINNIVDYNSNFNFVQHVLSMDTTFEGNTLQGRAITSPTLHHMAYALIIAMELGTGLLCLFGCSKMMSLRSADFEAFFGSIMLASYGLALGLLLWFGGFMIVGAEWFLMWQSDTWNGQDAAFRFLVSIVTTLIFLHLPEPAPRA